MEFTNFKPKDFEPDNLKDSEYPPISRKPRRFGLGSIIVLILIIIALMTALGVFRGSTNKLPRTNNQVRINTKAPIFVNSASNLGLAIDQYSGFFNLSPNGSKIVFNGIYEDKPQLQTFFSNLETGEIKAINGNLISDWVADDVLLLTEGNTAVLHDFSTNREYRIPTDGNIYKGTLSPNRQLYIMNTTSGLKLMNMSTGAVSNVSTSPYDGAYAWMRDNIHVIGFRDTGVKLAGGDNERVLTVWDTTSNLYKDLPIQVPIKSLKFVEWVTQDKVLRVNAGFDDNSHDYLLNLQSNTIVDLGETSGMLMGGVSVDEKSGLIALIGPIYSSAIQENVDVARIYDNSGNLIREVIFKKTDPKFITQRESMAIVSSESLIYVKKTFSIADGVSKGENNLVLLDMETGEENVYNGLSTKLTRMALALDKDTWVTMDTNQFYIGSVKNGIISPKVDVPLEEKKVVEKKENVIVNPGIQAPVQKEQNSVVSKTDVIRQYLNANLNTLSKSVCPVLGGKFFVTDLQVTSNNTGIVWYEDGHVAARAYFDYLYDTRDNKVIFINNFQAEKLLLTGGKR